MAQDAELKLKVSLDLAFFRQQLSTVGAQLGGQSIQLNVQFDRKAIANQYRLLDNALSRRTFKVKIESPTLDKLADKVSTFKKNLAALGDEKIDLAINVVSNIDEIRKSIKGKLPSVQIQTELAEPTNVDDFIREVGKKVKGQVEKSYVGGGVPIATKLETPGTTSLLKALQKNFNNQDPLRAKVSTTPYIIGEDVRAFRDAVKEKFSGIVVKIKAELEGAGQGVSGQGARGFSQAALRKLGQDIKPLYRAAADAGLVEFNESIANNIQGIARELSAISGDLIEGLLNGLKSKDPQVKAAAKSLGQALISSIKGILGIASPSKVFKAIGEDVGKGFELGAVASMDKAFDALEQKLQERLRKLQSMLSLAPSRRSAFPFVAMGGALESGPIAREIDQAYAQIAQIQERRQGRLAAERGSLAQVAGRLLPPARDRSLPAARETVFPGDSALGQVTRGFVQSLKNTRDTLARNFSANTYLPRATRALATSMNVATKQLSGTRIAGLLPSKEMMEPLRFQRAQQRAAQIDAENIARQQAQQAAQQASLRGMFEGVPRINAPRVGQEETAIGRHIQNKIEQAIRNARQTLGLPLGPSSPYVPNPFAGAATVPPRQYFQAGGQAALPPAGGTGLFAELQRNTEEMLRRNERMIASTDRAMAALDRMIAARSGGGALPPGAPPRQPPSGPPIQPPSGGGGGGALAFPGGGMGPSSQLPPGYHFLGTLPTNLERAQQFLNQRTLPLTSAIKDLAGEFGHAAQQVLLYGTAYKALAFFTSLPGQAFEAAKGLETFRNQLAAVTDSTGQFGSSLKFIENSVKELNIPIESAREGFTRLFASLQPAGFDPGTIQNLFGGITKAAATFGLSADEVDRVFYAFGQMASKGQVMSEELKGQLGDVLPGSVALFAEAAKMSMTEFSQALEDGMFKGDAMKVLLENVATLMSTKFSDAATKASRTLQGQMNAMQNSLTLMYESLQPMVNAFAAAVGPVIQSMISDATEVIKAFTSNVVIGGEAFGLMTPRAQDFYSTLKELIPSIVAAAKNIGEFGKSLGIFVSPLVTAVKLVSDFIAIPFVGRVALYATIIGGLTTAFQLLVSTGIVQAIASMIRFMSTLSLVQISTWIAGIRSAIASLVAMARTADLAKLSLMALKVTLISFGVGAVLIGLDYVIQRLMGIGDAANKARQRAAELTDELNRAVEAGNTAMASERYVQAETRVQSIEKAQGILFKMRQARSQGRALPISQQEFETLQRTGLASGIDYRGGVARAGRGQIEANLEAAQRGRIQALNEAGQAQDAMRDAAEVAINRQRQLDAQRRQLQDIPPGGGDEKAKKGKRTPLKQILDFENQWKARIEASKIEERLQERIRDAKLAGNEAEAKSLQNLSKALDIQGKIGALQEYRDELIEKEDQIIRGGLTKKEYNNKLQEANVKLLELSNDLKIAFYHLQVKEADAAKDAQDELNKKVEKQKELNRLIEDAQIAAGIIPPQQAAIIQQRRGFEDAVTRAKEAGASPGQLAQLTAAQALIPEAGSLQETIKTLREELDKLTSSQELVKASALSIGDAFSKSFKDAITGASSAQEALAGFFQSVASSFADMAAQMIQKMIQIYILDKFLNILPGGGMFKGNASIQGGGFGSFSGGAFGIDAGGSLGQVGQNLSIRPFANGGIVTGPTMGLIGEGRYNEAVVPLPDGKSIPVDLGGGMGDSGVNIVVNVDAKGTNVQGDNQMGKQLGGAISAAVQAELIKQKRPGGLLAR